MSIAFTEFTSRMPSTQLFNRLQAIVVTSCLSLAIACSFSPEVATAVTLNHITNVSNSTTSSVAPQIAVSVNGDVYLLWQESANGLDIQFASSTDPDSSFSIPVDLSPNLVVRNDPIIATSNDMIFIMWVENGEIYFSNSTADNNGKVNFGVPVSLSNNEGDSRNPQLAASGNNVYVVWEDDIDGSGVPDIFYTNSTDGGRNFSTPANLSENDGESRNPKLAIADSGNVYVGWQDDTTDPGNVQEIIVRASVDNGFSFGDIAVANNPSGFSSSPSVVADDSNNIMLVWEDATQNSDVFFASGSIDVFNGTITLSEFANVSENTGSSTAPEFLVTESGKIYVAWLDDINSTAGNSDVLIANSTDGGITFSPPISLSSGASASFGSLHLNLLPNDGESVYGVWRDASVGSAGSGDIFLVEITNDGHDISAPINLSDNDGFSQKPVLGAHGEELFVAWHDNSSLNNEVLFMVVSAAAGETSFINIQSPSDSSPKWGRPIQVSGVTNGADGDSVVVEWGDGSSTPGVQVDGGVWGPTTHQYDLTSVGPKEITARLVDSGGTEKATSDPEPLTVLKHETALTIEHMPNAVVQGNNITVTGSLIDTDDGLGISNVTIVFGGTGSGGLNDASTDSAGLYDIEGASPDSADTLWTLQASFDGNFAYETSSSEFVTFDTVSGTSTQFVVPVGSPSAVELTGFNASITFDKIETQGTLFVSSCDPPDSTRYISIGLCFVISSAEDLPPGSFAHLTVYYSGQILPTSHLEDEIDIFHQGLNGFVDITESRNAGEKSVTGRVSHFSKFVAAIALHDAAEEGTIRKQVYVGANELVFNELAGQQISFDRSEYSIGNTVTIHIEDETVNLDPLTIDTMNVDIKSDRDPAGITISLVETGNNTSVFTGAFTLDEDSSSSIDRLLRVRSGDTISGSYFVPASGPFKIIFSDVAESGMVDVRVSEVERPYVPSFEPIGDAYEPKLVDTRLANNSLVTVVMSYVNVDLTNDEIISTGLFRVLELDPDGGVSGAFEWFDITREDANGNQDIDTMKKTVTGTTAFLSSFVIGHDVRAQGDPGRGGGGLPRPGTGILLDVVASVANDESARESSGGGGGGSRSAGITQTYSGSNIETTVSTRSGPVTMKFDSVQTEGGQLRVEPRELSAFPEIFEEIATMADNEHGMIHLEGVTYSSAGDIFDIDASTVNFDGMVKVTIPYDENAVTSISGSESDVRFLHYDEETGVWEDNTVSSDALTNTVTGRLDSLSPVLAAVIINQDVESNRLVVSDPSFVTSETASEATLTMNLNSKRQAIQNYVIIAQVLDQKGVVQHIEWQERSIAGAKEENVSMIWVQTEDPYVVKVFIWTEMENPAMLSPVILPRMDI
jgi:hypothetical protein